MNAFLIGLSIYILLGLIDGFMCLARDRDMIKSISVFYEVPLWLARFFVLFFASFFWLPLWINSLWENR